MKTESRSLPGGICDARERGLLTPVPEEIAQRFLPGSNFGTCTRPTKVGAQHSIAASQFLSGEGSTSGRLMEHPVYPSDQHTGRGSEHPLSRPSGTLCPTSSGGKGKSASAFMAKKERLSGGAKAAGSAILTCGQRVSPLAPREGRSGEIAGRKTHNAKGLAVLICPGERPAVCALAQSAPLGLMFILGKTLLEYWLDHLVDRGVRHVYLVAPDRPEQIRAWLGDGVRWELKVDVIAEDRELSSAEARAKYRAEEGWCGASDEVTVMDFLPGAREHPLFGSYADWFAALMNWLPKAASAPDRVGWRNLNPGIWMGLHSRVAPDAQLRAPCWIGKDVSIGPRAIVGPNAIVEDGAVVAADAEIARSIVGPETYVGELTEVKHSLARGSTLIDWQSGSCTHVPDAFLLSPLEPTRGNNERFPGGWPVKGTPFDNRL